MRMKKPSDGLELSDTSCAYIKLDSTFRPIKKEHFNKKHDPCFITITFSCLLQVQLQGVPTL
jgi:hypothetical protein